MTAGLTEEALASWGVPTTLLGESSGNPSGDGAPAQRDVGRPDPCGRDVASKPDPAGDLLPGRVGGVGTSSALIGEFHLKRCGRCGQLKRHLLDFARWDKLCRACRESLAALDASLAQLSARDRQIYELRVERRLGDVAIGERMRLASKTVHERVQTMRRKGIPIPLSREVVKRHEAERPLSGRRAAPRTGSTRATTPRKRMAA